MPQNRRDTLYLESMIGTVNMAMSAVCMEFVSSDHPVRETTVLTLLSSLAPLTWWASLWLVIGVFILYGCFIRHYKMLEYCALLSAATWLVVAYYAFGAPRRYPSTTAMSPVFAFYSAVIYIYQSRQASKAARLPHGRTAEPTRG